MDAGCLSSQPFFHWIKCDVILHFHNNGPPASDSTDNIIYNHYLLVKFILKNGHHLIFRSSCDILLEYLNYFVSIKPVFHFSNLRTLSAPPVVRLLHSPPHSVITPTAHHLLLLSYHVSSNHTKELPTIVMGINLVRVKAAKCCHEHTHVAPHTCRFAHKQSGWCVWGWVGGSLA